MRIFAGLAFACSLAALLCARFLAIGEAWYASLYLLPLAATLFAVGLVAAIFEWMLGTAFRPVAAALAFALMLFAVLYAVFEGPPGVLPPSDLRLADLPAKALSVAALGAAVGGVILAAYAMRSPLFVPQLGASITLGAGLLVARQTVVGFGLPFLSWWSSGLVAVSLVVFVFSAGMRRRAQRPDEPQTGGDGGDRG
jgi:hypothetical protein